MGGHVAPLLAPLKGRVAREAERNEKNPTTTPLSLRARANADLSPQSTRRHATQLGLASAEWATQLEEEPERVTASALARAARPLRFTQASAEAPAHLTPMASTADGDVPSVVLLGDVAL
jgi:hypothetical protein